MKKIVTVCGAGIGTSVLLKMNVEKVLRGRSDVEVLASDIDSAPDTASGAALVLSSREFEPRLRSLGARIVVIDNFFDLSEIADALAGIQH